MKELELEWLNSIKGANFNFESDKKERKNKRIGEKITTDENYL